MKKLHAAVLLLTAALATTSAPVDSAELVRQFTGNGNGTTPVFTVESPWLLDWRLDGPDWQTDGRASRFSALEITLVNADNGRHVGRVKYTKSVGNGLRMFETSGRFQFKVSTTHARWTMRVEQLTREEAALYKPKE